MTDTRSHFHDELQGLEDAMMDSAERAGRLAAMATDAMANKDLELARQVQEGDLEIDARHKLRAGFPATPSTTTCTTGG